MREGHMGNEKGKTPIGRVLESLPGDTVLVTLDGTLLARKCSSYDCRFSEWPYVSLFSGTGKACRLYWKVPGGYDPALTVGPLELLLGDLVTVNPEYWLKRLLVEPADSMDFLSIPQEVRNTIPLKLSALKIREGAEAEAQGALQVLLPYMKTYVLSAGFMFLKLHSDQETADDWSESIIALLSEELMMDPLMIHGEEVLDLRMLHAHASALRQLSEILYKKGFRGVHSLLNYLPELAVGKVVENPVPLINDLSRIIEPVLRDQDLCQTASEFIRNNLNISETAQILFLHRNTLVYRLGKIEKLTGLDLKRSDQAMAFILLKAAREGDSNC